MLDQAARQVIETDLTRNLLVEASAGSGKTHSLTRRMLRGLAEGLYTPQTMAAVTFTNKAAAELRGRLRIALEEALRENPSERLSSALDNLDRMFLGTIHSFCGRLLREYPVEAGVSPGFREIEDLEDGTLQSSVFQRCLEERRGRDLSPVLAEAGLQPSVLLGALTTICNNGDANFSAPQVPRPEAEPVWEQLQRLAVLLESGLPAVDPASKCKLQERAVQFLTKFRSAQFGVQTMLDLLGLWESDCPATIKWWGATRAQGLVPAEPVIHAVEAFRHSSALPFLAQWRAFLYGQSVGFLSYVREQFALERKRLGVLNFQDLLLGAARLLRERPEVRAQLANKFRYLFVDEFQDTDPIQAETLFRLCCDEHLDGDWTRLALRPGALFLVGDPKQSIYRFRRADIEVYNLVRQRLLECGGEVVRLETSFRSDPSLCDWTNRVFAALLPSEPHAHQAAFSPLHSHRSEAVGELSGVFGLTDDSPRYNDCSRAEAPRIAGVIRQLYETRGYEWGDFLILTSKKADLAFYEDALAALEIPADVTGNEVRRDGCIPLLLELVSALTDHRNAVSTVGLLRGPLFGVDDPTLYRHKTAGGSFSMFSELGEPAVLAAFARLREMRGWLEGMPVGAALEHILDQSGLLALAGARRQADELVQAVDRMRGLVQQGIPLPEVISDPRAFAGTQPLSLRCGRRASVRLMNLHQAKGLEARVVFLASPCGGFPVSVSHRIVRSGAQVSGWLSISQGWNRVAAQPIDWEDHRLAEEAHLRAERERLLYVAATRAAETLIVSRWSGNHGSAQRPWAAFAPYVTDELPVAPSGFHGPEPETPAHDFAAVEAQRGARISAAREPSWSRSSMSVLAKDGVLGSSFVFDSAGGPGGAEWGSLVHRLLEHVLRDPSLQTSDLARIAAWAAFEEPDVSEFVSEALQAVERVRASPFWTACLGARERLIEVPVGVRRGTSLLFGVLDLVLGSEDGWGIVDWKTDRVALDVLVDKYRGQLLEYAGAWGEIVGEVQAARLFGVREGKASASVLPKDA